MTRFVSFMIGQCKSVWVERVLKKEERRQEPVVTESTYKPLMFTPVCIREYFNILDMFPRLSFLSVVLRNFNYVTKYDITMGDVCVFTLLGFPGVSVLTYLLINSLGLRFLCGL